MQELTNEEIVLAGLGKAGRRVAKQDLGASKVRQQFIERIQHLPKDIQRKLLNHRAQPTDGHPFSKGEINGTRAELIRTSQPEQIGITNIDNGKLSKDQHMVLSGIKLMYDPSNIQGLFTSSFPAALLNGQWELEVDGRKVLPKQTIRSFFDGFFGYDINKPFGVKWLNHTKEIAPQTNIEFNVDLPSALTGFLYVEFLGTLVISK